MRPLAPLLILAFTACDRVADGEIIDDSTDSERTDTGSNDLDDINDTGSTGTEEPEWQASYQSGTVVDVSSGKLSGVEEGDLRVFRGVPYAAPPVAGLRLRDPEPVAPWSGTLDASTFGPACPQRTVGVVDWLSQVDETDEDCLTLNIWAHDDGTAKPVMVWLHGGAFFYGAGSQDMYDGASIASDDVVVVTVNYRLGALGFLAHPELGANIGNAGNFGLKDQVMALQWVHDNIAALGGDPNNVTLFGESAGGISSCILATTPAAAPLIDKVIGQSPVGCHKLATATEPGAVGGAPARAYSEDFVADLGCSDAADTLACLQAVPVDSFLDAVAVTDLLTDMDTPFPFPWMDGSFLPQQPGEAYASGATDVPMLLGTTADEATLFLSTQAPLTWLGVPSKFDTLTRDRDLTNEALGTYPVWKFPMPRDAFLTFATDAMFSCPTQSLAASTSGGAPVYLYEFQDKSLTTVALGSHHAIELPYLFNTFAAMGMFPTPSNQELGAAMRGAWTSFARTGAPEIDGGWPAYQAGGEVLVLDDSWGLIGDEDHRNGRCDELTAMGIGLSVP